MELAWIVLQGCMREVCDRMHWNELGGDLRTVVGNRVITMRRARKANTGVISAMIFVGVAMGALAMMITMVAR